MLPPSVLLVHGHHLHLMNHWVACYPIAGSAAPAILGEGVSETELTFYDVYFSLWQQVEVTVRDGSCGLDAMCLMLGWPRTLANRMLLRNELASFVFKHSANRALIYMLSET